MFPPVVGWNVDDLPDDDDDRGDLFHPSPTISVLNIDVNTCEAAADETDIWGDAFMCGFAQELALVGPNITSVEIENEDGVSIYTQSTTVVYDDWLYRAFHPKTVAYKRIRARIYYYYWTHFWT